MIIVILIFLIGLFVLTYFYSKSRKDENKEISEIKVNDTKQEDKEEVLFLELKKGKDTVYHTFYTTRITNCEEVRLIIEVKKDISQERLFCFFYFSIKQSPIGGVPYYSLREDLINYSGFSIVNNTLEEFKKFCKDVKYFSLEKTEKFLGHKIPHSVNF